jgi:hypothetical protein
MKHILRDAMSVAALVGLFATPTSFAAFGEITVSGSTWTGKVDGVTRYTGSNMAAAANACIAAMSSGTLNIKNSGTVNGQINIKSNISVTGNGTQATGGGSGGIIRATNASNLSVSNLRMAGSAWFGMYFSTCQTMTFSGVNGTSGIAFRIDNCKGGSGSNLQVGSPTIGSGGDNGVETYGINGVKWGTVTATDRGACGLLLNQSSSASGTAVNGTRCNVGGGYAGFRVANNNRSTTLGTANSNNCGRGFFSVSGSSGATVTTVNATNCTSHGIWLQTTSNTRVNGGTVRNCHPCTSISQDLGGNSIRVSCQ